MIYILYGAVGVGKKTVRNVIANSFGLQIIDKYTTEEVSPEDYEEDAFNRKRLKRDRSLISVDEASMNANSGAYIYDVERKLREDTGKQEVVKLKYGILKRDIQEAMEKASEGVNYLLVCSSEKALDEIERDYEDSFRKVLVVGYTGKAKKQFSDQQMRQLYEPLIKKANTFFGVIHNRNETDEEKRNNFIVQQWKLITKEEPIERNKSIFFIKPFFSKPIDVEFVQKEICATLDALEVEHEDYTFSGAVSNRCVYSVDGKNKVDREEFIYQHINREIKKINSNLKASVVKNDVDNNNKLIVNNIISQIKNAGLIIADISKHRLNCYYELALARALNKKIIVITEDIYADDIIFDEIGYNHFSYRIPKEINPLTHTKVASKIEWIPLPADQPTFCDCLAEYIGLQQD